MQPFIETRSGGEFWPLEPRRCDVDIEDIAHALSNQCRFSGHTRVHYSVAEHSVRVSRLLKEWGASVETQLWGLLHDASEAYLVDLPSPLKLDPRFAFYKVAERQVMTIICERFELPLRMPDAVVEADAVLLSTEVRDLMNPRSGHWSKLTHAPHRHRIYPMTQNVAMRTFLSLFNAL
jgi:5'-deoxynucleotidase YfbR-like HD superfamily hydrolase